MMQLFPPIAATSIGRYFPQTTLVIDDRPGPNRATRRAKRTGFRPHGDKNTLPKRRKFHKGGHNKDRYHK